MTAPLVDVLVQRPGAAFGRAFDDPANGFLHAVDLDLAQREHDAFTRAPAPPWRRRARAGVDRPAPRPDLRLRSGPRQRSRNHRPALGQADPARRGDRARTLAGGPRHPHPGPDSSARHGRRRRHVLAPAGPLLHRPHAAHERRRRAPARRASSAATSASSTSPTGAARRSCCTSCRLSPRSPTTSRWSTCPCFPPGLWELLARPRGPADQRPGRRVRHARQQRPGRAPGGLRRRRRQPDHASRARSGGLRGAFVSRPGDRDQWLRRAHVPDPADPPAHMSDRSSPTNRPPIRSGWRPPSAPPPTQSIPRSSSGISWRCAPSRR